MTELLLAAREEEGAVGVAMLTVPAATPAPTVTPRLPDRGEAEGGLPADILQAAKDAADKAEATESPATSVPPAVTTVPPATGAPEATTELTATPAPVPQEAGGGQAGLPGWLSSPWLSIALGVCALGLLVSNIVLLLRRRKSAVRVQPAASAGPSGELGVRVGRVHEQGARQYQQDCLAVSDPADLGRQGLLAVVADGMGGLSDGEKLSAAAVEAALEGFALSTGTEKPEHLLLTLAKRATQAVNRTLGPANYRKGGTTLLLGLIRGGSFYYLTVGDSHIYLLRGGALVLLNREHVYTSELALQSVNGEMTAAEAYGNKEGGGLVSYLGMGTLKYADIPAEPVKIVPGDKFILMSDGVYNALTQAEMETLLDGPVETAAARLGQAIAAKGYVNQDNYTAVILDCGREA